MCLQINVNLLFRKDFVNIFILSKATNVIGTIYANSYQLFLRVQTPVFGEAQGKFVRIRKLCIEPRSNTKKIYLQNLKIKALTKLTISLNPQIFRIQWLDQIQVHL